MPRKLLQLHASASCRICGGRGWIRDPDPQDCSCVFENAPDDPASEAAIDAGDYEVISARPCDHADYGRYW